MQIKCRQLESKTGKLFTSKKEPQPATSERPMATRLCWRKRSRMLQHLAPAASATPSSDLVHPLHRSVSHSCPAQSSYSSARPPAQARASRGQEWKFPSQDWVIAAPCASLLPHVSQDCKKSSKKWRYNRPGEARTCSEAGAGLGAAARLAVAAHKADAALGRGAATELLAEVLAGQAGAAAVAAAHAGAGRVRRPGLPRVMLGPLVHHLCLHSKALMSCLTRRLHLIPMRATALSGFSGRQLSWFPPPYILRQRPQSFAEAVPKEDISSS